MKTYYYPAPRIAVWAYHALARRGYYRAAWKIERLFKRRVPKEGP